MIKTLSFVWDMGKMVLLAFVLVVLLRVFIFQPFLVRGASMEPNFHDFDYLIVDEVSYRFREPARGEVVVFKFPNDPSQRYIKRLIGLPGETIEVQDGKVYIVQGEDSFLLDEGYIEETTPGSVRLELGPNEYFVLGDNRVASSDSRSWGSLSEDLIIGRVLVRVFPFNAFAKLEQPAYETL